MKNIKDILGMAFEIGNDKKFDVYIEDECSNESIEHWTYIQLGMYLIQQYDNIKSVHILKKTKF